MKITESDKIIVIDELRHKYKIGDLIKTARIPRSTYYYWVKAQKSVDYSFMWSR